MSAARGPGRARARRFLGRAAQARGGCEDRQGAGAGGLDVADVVEVEGRQLRAGAQHGLVELHDGEAGAGGDDMGLLH